MSTAKHDTQLNIEFCGAWGYRPRAFRLKGVLDGLFIDLPVTPTVGRSSSFEVTLHHEGKVTVLYSKLEKGVFPDDANIIKLIKEHAKHIQFKGWYSFLLRIYYYCRYEIGYGLIQSFDGSNSLLCHNSGYCYLQQTLAYCLSVASVISFCISISYCGSSNSTCLLIKFLMMFFSILCSQSSRSPLCSDSCAWLV